MNEKQRKEIDQLITEKNAALENRETMLAYIRRDRPSLDSDNEAIDDALNHLINTVFTVRMAFAMVMNESEAD